MTGLGGKNVLMSFNDKIDVQGTVGGPFCGPFLWGPFLCGFWSSENAKKWDSHGFQKRNDENFGFCIFCLGHFSTKDRNICLFLVVLSNFLCF